MSNPENGPETLKPLLNIFGKKRFGSVGLCAAAITALILFFPCPGFCSDSEKERVDIGLFSENSLENWEEKVFEAKTLYRLVRVDGQTVLAGEANASASGLFKKVGVDLRKTPFLNWSWRVENAHPPLDETTKSGDDYAARIYLVKDGGLIFWKTIALNYVWSSSQARGSSWPSSYAGDNVMLMALRSRDDKLGKWHVEKRNVYADFKKLFGKEIDRIDAVAVMTDSDNSNGRVKAYYGDIYFTGE